MKTEQLQTHKLVGMSIATAQWLGNAAAVAGGCVSVNDEGREAAQIIGYDCIGLIPVDWRGSYHPLTTEQIERVKLYLCVTCHGWSGANRINAERKACLEMLGLS